MENAAIRQGCGATRAGREPTVVQLALDTTTARVRRKQTQTKPNKRS
jgi:hypothetical protein